MSKQPFLFFQDQQPFLFFQDQQTFLFFQDQQPFLFFQDRQILSEVISNSLLCLQHHLLARLHTLKDTSRGPPRPNRIFAA